MEQNCEKCKHFVFDTRMNVDICEYGFICQFEPEETAEELRERLAKKVKL